MALTDEHCGPEVVLPRREPCLSVRADALLGVDIALTALPLATLPLTYLLRDLVKSDEPSGAQSLSVSLRAGRDTVSASVSIAAF